MLRIHGTKLSQSKFSWMSWLGLAGTVSCCALVLVFGLMLFPSLPQETYAAPEVPVNPPSVGTSVGINLPASIDFDSVTPTPDGATTTATADLTVTTTNSASYSLYLYSSDGDNSLKPKISANTSSIIATAGGVGLTLSSLEPNTWGYALENTEPTDATTYVAVPTDDSAPVRVKDTSDTNSANDTYTLSFGAKVNTSISSGIYSNTLTIAVVAEPMMITVAFNSNGAEGSMSSIKIPAGGTQLLPSNTFIRSNYTFTGWNTASNGGGTGYENGSTLATTREQAGQTITLYAQWKPDYYIQDFTYSQCQSLASEANFPVRDKRDDNDYTVRYINGACWMTQNLKLSSDRTLTSADSNVTRDWVFTTGSLWSGSTYTEPRSEISSISTRGGYYNFCAASAGTVCSQTKIDSTQDICPKGWRLPTSGEMTGIVSYASDFSPSFSGYYSGNSFANSGGYWWSATAYSDTYQYYLQLSSSGVLDIGRIYYSAYTKGSGFSVRCIKSS